MDLRDDVAAILDDFFENGCEAPDWAAIGLKIHLLEHPREAMLELLKVMHFVYEDSAAFLTVLYAR